ncbi:BQ2448_742 [Microbotryum intermedium]|uniref:BQ2448_742 protein n=1 Tax=Microbotryum intermedium TaxID=269621 RepID=A0A238F935_9BASI|nr:BQ2448_742 [Microbotryum intermedium]
MPLLKRNKSRSVSSASSVGGTSDTSSATSASILSASSKGGKVKASDLTASFANSASPNSRLLSLENDRSGGGASLSRSLSNKSNGGASAARSPKLAVASDTESDEEESASEHSSDDDEESEEEAPKRGALLQRTTISGSAKSNSSKRGTSKAGDDDDDDYEEEASTDDEYAHSVKGAPVAAGANSDDSDDSDAPPKQAAEPQKRGPSQRNKVDPREIKKPVKRQNMNRAAKLANEAMEKDIKLRSKLGKPLTSLTWDDVALKESDIKEDITTVWKAMHLFMSSRMIEAEDICLAACDNRLYYAVGYALIQSIKSLATFEPEDLEAAISCCKDSILIAQLLRKKDHGLLENVGRLAKGSTSVNSIKSMTTVQRHAELVFSECTLLKAVLGIIYSGDFVAFLKEALNMRNAYAIYRTLAAYVESMDKAAGGHDDSIDEDFRSGVYLGNGLISLILSLLPSAVLKIMTVFGFTGDREYALTTLMLGGRWKPRTAEPGMPPEQEGIRRPICDMVLLMHHLVIANYLPVGGVDVPTAAHILHYNLDRYPNGIFFLYFAGRLHSTETQLEAAVKSFHLAIAAQREYIQLGHICYWDLGLVSLASGDWIKGYECFNILDKESNWSKAIYAYAKATSIYEQGEDIAKANKIMKGVPDLMQRIAGKSIPLEKFVARRSRKYVAQGNRLCLPGIELAYVLNCLGLSPRFNLFEVHLDQISTVLADLHQVKDPSRYGNGDEFWDGHLPRWFSDYCLAHLLRGIVLHFIAHPQPHVDPRPKKSQIPPKEADEQALISFNNVLKHGRDLQHDHHLVWFTHYELGRLYDSMGQFSKAREHFEKVMSGKNLELSPKKTKGKVSLQNMAVLRSNSALSLLKERGH